MFYNDFTENVKQFNVIEVICFDDNFAFAFQWNCRRLNLNHRIRKVKFLSVYDKYCEYFEDCDFDYLITYVFYAHIFAFLIKII